MARTLRDFEVPGASVANVSEQVRQWYAENRFRIIDGSADGSVKTYDAPELARDRGRASGGHLRFSAPRGSIVALNVAAGGGSTPTVFSVAVTQSLGGAHIHGEFFGPTSIESFGGPIEFEMINTIWAPAGIQRKKAYVLVTAFEGFVASLRSHLPNR